MAAWARTAESTLELAGLLRRGHGSPRRHVLLCVEPRCTSQRTGSLLPKGDPLVERLGGTCRLTSTGKGRSADIPRKLLVDLPSRW